MDVKLYLQCTLNKSPTKKTHPETGCRQEARQICAPSNCELVKSDKVDSLLVLYSRGFFVPEVLCFRWFLVSEGSLFHSEVSWFQKVLCFIQRVFGFRGFFVSEVHSEGGPFFLTYFFFNR
jgi:hypothetical protein